MDSGTRNLYLLVALCAGAVVYGLVYILTPFGGPACAGCPGDRGPGYTYCMNGIRNKAEVLGENSSFEVPDTCRKVDGLPWMSGSDRNLSLSVNNGTVVVKETGREVLTLEDWNPKLTDKELS